MRHVLNGHLLPDKIAEFELRPRARFGCSGITNIPNAIFAKARICLVYGLSDTVKKNLLTW